MQTPTSIVYAWQAAANQPDIDRLLALSDANIEIIGPRGSGYGHQLLRDWIARAGLHLTTLRTFARAETVVLEQQAVWRSVDTGEIQGEAQIAARFRVHDQRVIQFARYDDIAQALAEAQLTPADEVPTESLASNE